MFANNPAMGRRVTVFLFVAILLAFTCGTARAQNLSLISPVIVRQADAMTARLGIRLEDMTEVDTALQNGAQYNLKCDVALYRRGNYWMDKKIGEAEFTSLLSYDPITKEYSLVLQGRDNPLRSRTLAKLLEEGWSRVSVDLGDWALLERGNRYLLEAKASMTFADVPDWFTRTLFFWSWDDGPQTTYRLDFKY